MWSTFKAPSTARIVRLWQQEYRRLCPYSVTLAVRCCYTSSRFQAAKQESIIFTRCLKHFRQNFASVVNFYLWPVLGMNPVAPTSLDYRSATTTKQTGINCFHKILQVFSTNVTSKRILCFLEVGIISHWHLQVTQLTIQWTMKNFSPCTSTFLPAQIIWHHLSGGPHQTNNYFNALQELRVTENEACGKLDRSCTQ